MESRILGKTDLKVSKLGLGCATFGREIDEEASFRIMDFAFEQGINLFDTAEAYGGGQARHYRKTSLGVDDVREKTGEMHSSEKILGRWLKSRGIRSDIIIQTKVSSNADEQHVRKSLEASLERLQTEWVDIYLFHNFDPQVPLEKGLSAFNKGVQSGKIRVIGCSNFGAEQLAEGLKISRKNDFPCFEVIQPNYNLVCREIEDDLLPLCREENVSVISYSPLGAGFLTGKYTSDLATIPKGTRFDVMPPHVDIYFHERSFRIVDQLRSKSKETGISMTQLAMAWVLGQKEISSVLVGARTEDHIKSALVAMEMNFPSEWMSEIDRW